jgi:DNA-directed RNA polymerase I subunit RPA2
MAKQTMGTPYHNHPYRMDNKVYRLLFPQAPLVRTETYEDYDFGLCPSGANAVVAVIAYTGYDMEDAMIINKGAYDRGFGHGCVYKSYIKEVNPDTAGTGNSGKSRYRMVNHKKDEKTRGLDLKSKGLDADGTPHIGKLMEHGDAELCTYDETLARPKMASFKDHESARIESIRLFGNEKDPKVASVGYTLRYGRNPVIGDKFSSRHG